jgi:hypothetical protein
MTTFHAHVATKTADEECLICGKTPKKGTKWLRVRADNFDLYYCPTCIQRAADALKG